MSAGNGAEGGAAPPVPDGPWVGAVVEGATVTLHAFDAQGRAGATAQADLADTAGADPTATPGADLARMAATLEPSARLMLVAGWPPLPSHAGPLTTAAASLSLVPAEPVPCPPLGTPPRVVHLPAGPSPASGSEPVSVLALPPVGQRNPLDLMGAASIRIAGLLSERPEFDGVLCLPGGRSYWAHISAGEIVSFQGFLGQDLLNTLTADADTRTEAFTLAFDTALAEILSRPERLAATLHRGLLDPATARATLGGALIGAELAAARPYWLGQQIIVLADDSTAEVYKRALDAQGAGVERKSARQMAMLGLAAARARL